MCNSSYLSGLYKRYVHTHNQHPVRVQIISRVRRGEERRREERGEERRGKRRGEEKGEERRGEERGEGFKPGKETDETASYSVLWFYTAMFQCQFCDQVTSSRRSPV